MRTFSLLQALAVLTSVAVADVFWTGFIAKVGEGRALAAGTFSAAIILTGAITTFSYIESRLYVVPAALGAFLGTYVTVWYKARR
jgi:hypothetical protein